MSFSNVSDSVWPSSRRFLRLPDATSNDEARTKSAAASASDELFDFAIAMSRSGRKLMLLLSSLSSLPPPIHPDNPIHHGDVRRAGLRWGYFETHKRG